MTDTLRVHATAPEAAAIEAAASLLRAGKLVAFATETVYGLGADATNTEAVAAIFDAKGRPRFDPIIVHLAEAEQLSTVAADPPLVPIAPEEATSTTPTSWPTRLSIPTSPRSYSASMSSGRSSTAAPGSGSTMATTPTPVPHSRYCSGWRTASTAN